MANYWYVSPSREGWMNLAVDEWFLDTLGEDDMLLYFYINQNDVIIGKNQNPWRECDLQTMEADGTRLVRRVSGGGAVYHDEGNLNFSFIAGKGRYDVQRQLGVILQAVRQLGIPCEFTGRNDLVADGRKFSGNAFCTRGGICQHHGTLLIKADMQRLQRYLKPDPRKMQAKGVSSVRARVCNLTEFVPDLTGEKMLSAIRRAFEAEYGTVTEISPTAEQLAAVMPYYEKQQSWQWRLGKTPAFDLELDTRFDWGGVQLLLTLKEGIVERAAVYSDAMDPELSAEVQSLLTGCRFGSKPMAEVLQSSEKEQINAVGQWLMEQGL